MYCSVSNRILSKYSCCVVRNEFKKSKKNNKKNGRKWNNKEFYTAIVNRFLFFLFIFFFFLVVCCLLFVFCFFFPFFCFWPAAPKKVNLSLIINIKNNDNNYWQNRYIIKGNSSSLISRRCNQNLRHCLVIFDFKLLAKFKKLLHMEFRATLNYLKNNSP